MTGSNRLYYFILCFYRGSMIVCLIVVYEYENIFVILIITAGAFAVLRAWFLLRVHNLRGMSPRRRASSAGRHGRSCWSRRGSRVVAKPWRHDNDVQTWQVALLHQWLLAHSLSEPSEPRHCCLQVMLLRDLCLKGKKKRRRALLCEEDDNVDVEAAWRDDNGGGVRALPADDREIEWWRRGGRENKVKNRKIMIRLLPL
jgi:hypothetical protein